MSKSHHMDTTSPSSTHSPRADSEYMNEQEEEEDEEAYSPIEYEVASDEEEEEDDTAEQAEEEEEQQEQQQPLAATPNRTSEESKSVESGSNTDTTATPVASAAAATAAAAAATPAPSAASSSSAQLATAAAPASSSSSSSSSPSPASTAALPSAASSASASSTTPSSSAAAAPTSSSPPKPPQSAPSDRSFRIAVKRLLSDFKQMESDPPEGVSGAPLDSSAPFVWRCCIFGPTDTAWEGGVFQLQMQFGVDYPQKPPSVRFLSKMYHPNVFADGALCLDIIQDKWSPIYTVSTILTSIQSLLTDPNPASPANPEAAKLMAADPKAYRKKVRACVEKSMEAV